MGSRQRSPSLSTALASARPTTGCASRRSPSSAHLRAEPWCALPSTHPSIHHIIHLCKCTLSPLPRSLPPSPTTPPPPGAAYRGGADAATCHRQRLWLPMSDGAGGTLRARRPHGGAQYSICACNILIRVWDAIMHSTMHCTMHRTLHCPPLQGGCDRGRVARWRVCGAERERDDRHLAHRGLPRWQRR